MKPGKSGDAYQIWHRDGDTFRKVAEVRSDDLLWAAIFTQNEELGGDPHAGQRWIDQAGVILAIEANPRSTDVGDVIIAPDGQEYAVSLVDTEFVFRLTDAIHRQEYDAYLAEQPEIFAEPELTPAEQTRLFQEWRSDAACRELTGKGVDYSDAPYAGTPGQSYAEQRAAAAASAKFHRPPGLDAPGL